MKRREIRERAAIIAGWFVESTKPEHEEYVESELLTLVRATLEDAARAGCWYCKNGNRAVHQEASVWSGWAHTFDDETPPEACRRGEIHDLIAALDKEGS